MDLNASPLDVLAPSGWPASPCSSSHRPPRPARTHNETVHDHDEWRAEWRDEWRIKDARIGDNR